MNHKDLLKGIIETLTSIVEDLEATETCRIVLCNRTAVARKLCVKHYNEWRRQYCRDHEIRKLRDEPKVVEPDPRQSKLFTDIEF